MKTISFRIVLVTQKGDFYEERENEIKKEETKNKKKTKSDEEEE